MKRILATILLVTTITAQAELITNEQYTIAVEQLAVFAAGCTSELKQDAFGTRCERFFVAEANITDYLKETETAKLTDEQADRAIIALTTIQRARLTFRAWFALLQKKK